MNVHEAIDSLEVIQAQLSRSTPVRGYRAATVGQTAVLGVVGACAQAAWVTQPLADRGAYLAVWVSLASLGFLAMSIEVGRRFVLTRSRHERHGLLHTLFSLLPAFATGGVVTVALAGRSDEVFALLPGLWMLSFALAIFASIPRLPKGAGFIACSYFAAGAWTLVQSAEVALSPWTMGGVFALGQAWATWLLLQGSEGADFPSGQRGGTQ